MPVNLGKIEVVVLRCHDAERAAVQSSKTTKTVTIRKNDRSLGLDGAWDGIVDTAKRQPTTKPVEQAQSAETTVPWWAQAAYSNYYNQQQYQQPFWNPQGEQYH